MLTADAVFQFTGRDIQDAVENRNEHGRVTLAHQHIIDILEAVARRNILKCSGFQQRAAHGHEDSCRNALTGHVPNYKSKPILTEQKKVVEVTADFASGYHLGVNRKISPRWKFPRQNR